jgi:hypothetical protein
MLPGKANKKLSQRELEAPLITVDYLSHLPHSLSYHATTFSRSSPTTIVKLESTVDETSVDRKSMETRGRSDTARMPLAWPSAASLNAWLTCKASNARNCCQVKRIFGSQLRPTSHGDYAISCNSSDKHRREPLPSFMLNKNSQPTSSGHYQDTRTLFFLDTLTSSSAFTPTILRERMTASRRWTPAHLLRCDVLLDGVDHQVHNRHVWCRHTESNPVQLALELRQDQGDRLGSSRGGGNNVEGGSTGSPQITVGSIQQPLHGQEHEH